MVRAIAETLAERTRDGAGGDSWPQLLALLEAYTHDELPEVQRAAFEALSGASTAFM